MTRVERMTTILLLLQQKRRTAESLGDELGVGRRTVLRDVQSLVAMGVPVIAESGPNGGYEIPRESTLSPLHLTWREALLLMLALEGLAKMSDTPFLADRTALLAKVHALVPDSQRQKVEAILGRVEIEVPKRPQRTPLLETLMSAVGGWVELGYNGSVRVVRVDRLYADRGFWYVAGVTEGKSRVYRADRVESVSPCEAPVGVAEPLSYTDSSHPLVRVMLTEKGAQRAQGDPHLGPHVFGEGLVEFRCPPDEIAWYARYFAAFGDDARVEGPPELIERIRQDALAVLDRYRVEP